MAKALSVIDYHEREKELIDILIDSDLYLDLDLAERRRLIRFLLASYFEGSAK